MRQRPARTADALPPPVRKGTRTITMHALRKNAASDVSALLVGSAGVKSVTHHKSNAMADYYAKHAEPIAMNRKVVEKWNEAIAEKGERSAAKRRAALKRVKEAVTPPRSPECGK